ncbi:MULTISPECIES: hypothetical protein [unclassified Nostoc]|uniref:hypothetical protein n=1 Tax=unclassified Nostoc TaxID=2593658 RepID=UPI002AD47674|nr:MULTISPECIES: hypothetical protein [unclassified Nostoc]MDZ8122676.1 hypothetical protein [Nostoc sp. CmiVER01]MDZ8226799.1 hypothetical protein [Nostoc sp. ChiVER01]
MSIAKFPRFIQPLVTIPMVGLTTFSIICLTHDSALAGPDTSSPWAIIQNTFSWARWAPAPFLRWDFYNDLDNRVQLVGDPTTKSAVYFLKSDGSVGYRNVDQNINETFPGITAKQIAVGQSGRLWAITTDGRWARWAPAPFLRWDIYNDLDNRVQLVGDPLSEGGIYFRKSNGSVGYRNVDQNINKTFPGITAKQIAVGQSGRLWAITTDGRWARWAPAPFLRWDIYNDLDNRVQLVGDPQSEGGIYFRKSDGSVGYRNVDQNINRTYPGIGKTTDLTVSDPEL